MGVRYHWIRELIDANIIALVHEKSENNQSDLMKVTKESHS